MASYLCSSYVSYVYVWSTVHTTAVQPAFAASIFFALPSRLKIDAYKADV